MSILLICIKYKCTCSIHYAYPVSRHGQVHLGQVHKSTWDNAYDADADAVHMSPWSHADMSFRWCRWRCIYALCTLCTDAGQNCRVMKQRCLVRWSNSLLSKDFGIGNGTCQGSCLSPALFSLYMNELLQELRNSSLGCYVGGVFAGAGSYCDDLVLLAPTQCIRRFQNNVLHSFGLTILMCRPYMWRGTETDIS